MTETPLTYPDEAAIDAWIGTLKPNSNTRRTYKFAFKKFLAWLEAENRHFELLDADVLNAYKVKLLADGAGPASVNLNLSAIRSYLKHVRRTDVIEAVSGETVKQVPHREFLVKEDIYALFATCDKTTELGLRDFCILNLMIRTGLREKEVAEALIGDLQPQGETAKLWVRGKGRTSKDDYVTLYPAVLGPLDEYLDTYRVRSDASAPLFTSLSNRTFGEALVPRTISHIIKQKLRQIGFDDSRYTGHSLRHTAITLALEAGATAKQVQTMARHADASTTQIYVHDYERRQHPAEEFIEEFLEK